MKKVILRLRKLSCFNSRLDGAPLVDWLALQISEKIKFTERRKKTSEKQCCCTARSCTRSTPFLKTRFCTLCAWCPNVRKPESGFSTKSCKKVHWNDLVIADTTVPFISIFSNILFQATNLIEKSVLPNMRSDKTFPFWNSAIHTATKACKHSFCTLNHVILLQSLFSAPVYVLPHTRATDVSLDPTLESLLYGKTHNPLGGIYIRSVE